VYYHSVGMLVVIVLAMALFVGLFILVAGVLCLTRYRHTKSFSRLLLKCLIMLAIDYRNSRFVWVIDWCRRSENA